MTNATMQELRRGFYYMKTKGSNEKYGVAILKVLAHLYASCLFWIKRRVTLMLKSFTTHTLEYYLNLHNFGKETDKLENIRKHNERQCST